MNPIISRTVRRDDGDKNMAAATASSYAIWNNFFVSAGIPNNVANEYAVTFSQHRIKIDMLKEITKEILRDMGIKAMGDIIAILRHAKELCTQDELKVAKKIAPLVLPTPSNLVATSNQPDTTVINTVSKASATNRTPTITSRVGPKVTSLVGAKLSSRVNLNSGAIIASTNNSSSQGQKVGTDNGNLIETRNAPIVTRHVHNSVTRNTPIVTRHAQPQTRNVPMRRSPDTALSSNLAMRLKPPPKASVFKRLGQR